MSEPKVYITRTATYLPNKAISNDEMEQYLGLIHDQASKSRRIVLRNNGIKNRYYALDKNGAATHTNAQLTALAIRSLFSSNPDEIKEVELITCGTSIQEQLLPSHAVMVHGELVEANNVEVVSPSGACCAGMHAMKYAYLSIKSGEKSKAVSTGSERLSRALRAEQFELEYNKLAELEENPYISFEKDFLRWMLSDGAGAFLLENKKSSNGISLRIEWMEGYSFANQLETCMYMGNEKLANGQMKSYLDSDPTEIVEKSILSIKQDVKVLSKNIVKIGFKRMLELLLEKGINKDEITWFLPHMSSFFFAEKIYEELLAFDYEIPKDRWFTNLATKGNVGAGSIYLMLDELFNSNKLQVGDKILLAVPESSRFSYMFAFLTVC